MDLGTLGVQIKLENKQTKLILEHWTDKIDLR